MLLRNTSRVDRWLCAALLIAFADSLPAQDAVVEPNQPPPEPGEIPIPLSPLPTTVVIGQYQVVIREPDEPDDSHLGGSGGPILGLTVTGPGLDEPKAILIQAIWLYAEDAGSRPPDFTLWSKTGVSSPVRCALEWHKPNYCVTECQNYEIGPNGLFPVDGPRSQAPCSP